MLTGPHPAVDDPSSTWAPACYRSRRIADSRCNAGACDALRAACIVLVQLTMQKKSLVHALASSLLLVGCVGSGSGYVRGSASVSAPDLVFVSPGVQVIADYDEPIFYSDSYYWRAEGNVWYRSSSYTGGWARFDVVPVGIRRIERPTAYIHYHGEVRANANANGNGNGNASAAAPGPSHEERKEQHEVQKDERKDQKEERKDQKEERKDHKNGHK